MSKQTIWSSISSAIKQFAGENNSMAIEIDGKKYNVTALEEGGLVTDEEGNPLKDGSFEVEGVTYKTDGVGALLKVEKKVSEESTGEGESGSGGKPPVEVTPPSEMEGEVVDVEALKAEIEELKKECADLKAEKVEAETKLETMKSQTPKATVISPVAPAQNIMHKYYNEMTNFEKLKFHRENG